MLKTWLLPIIGVSIALMSCAENATTPNGQVETSDNQDIQGTLPQLLDASTANAVINELIREADTPTLQRKLETEWGLTMDIGGAMAGYDLNGGVAIILPLRNGEQDMRGYVVADGRKIHGLFIEADPTETSLEARSPRMFLVSRNDGTYTVEKYVPSSQEIEAPHHADNSAMSESPEIGVIVQALNSSCAYVQSVGFSVGCIIPDSNPFGYYYTTRVRYGYGDPSMPQWWSCWFGSIHVCPQYQTGTYTFNGCGFPPTHPLG